jgi:hypothetical protein
MVSTQLPPRPDFEAIEAAAPASADRRTLILALIGNLSFSWSNNESLFIYVLMLLLNTDEVSAATVHATLNTTRARLELIQRLAKVHIKDRAIERSLDKIIERFNECTRVRNEFNHCMFSVNADGEITQTQSIKIMQRRDRLQWAEVKPMDDARVREMLATTDELKQINRDIWDFLPQLAEHLSRARKQPSPSK